jgi:hypothetical protein
LLETDMTPLTFAPEPGAEAVLVAHRPRTQQFPRRSGRGSPTDKTVEHANPGLPAPLGTVMNSVFRI